ncbi:Ig-like domain repeat protein [Methanobrevibacter intestini]|uniref:Ig-like domain repeat protein n=1 Tax=Methanobrevibacter intestini TaxID=2911853 RepID=UPI003D08F4C7
MSLKKNIGVLVLLLVLLSMSAVSAEDVSINTNDTYQAPNEIQKDFTSLQTDIDNSQNVFELNYDVKHGDDEKDNYGISITKTTIINGNGHTIDANGHGSIFVVKDSSVTLTLNDLTLINANPVSDSSGIVSNGGAVYFDGSTLIVNNVNFKNNTVYKYGGAIYTTGTCIVDSSVFDGNDVQFRSQNIDNGGAAIYADNGASLLISNSQIINNHKNMVIRDNNVGDLVDGVVVATGYTKISKSYFRNNSGCYGGAVTSLGYTNAGKNQIIIENSVFDANRAFQGAAVNVIGSTFKISGTNFTNNKGVGYGSGNPNVGALLTWYGCEGTISDCNFINNTAGNGAAYRLGDDHNGVSSASVDSCTFINNTATNQGGAIYEGGKTGKATLDIKNSTFANNSAKKEGSAIYNGYTLNIDDDTTFTNNMVYMYYTGTLNIGEIKTFTDLQKAINMVEGDIHLSSNVTMLDSEADKFVNGIVVDHLVNLKCDGFTINANNLGRIFNVTSTADKLNIYNANLINGNADIGGAIYNTGSVYAYNTAFKDNTAATMGGAVFNKGTLTIQKCIVDNNDITKRTSSASEDYGGAAIYNWYDSTLFIKNSTISNNLKNYKNGDYVVGAVTSLGKTTISQNSYFVNNSGRWGGAITTSGSSLPGKKVNELSISDSTFSKNGGLYGAGIFIEGSKFTITSCVFDSNTASGKGNMTPNDNNGAAIEVTNTDKSITGTISKSTFTNNKAQYGGAIDICAGTIKIINSKFINNSADVEGGAIDINTLNGNPKVTISSSKFINNSAPLGGAILNIKDLTVKGSTFINNTPNTIFNWAGAGGNLNLNIRTFTDLQNAIGLVTGTLTLNQNVAMTAKEAANFVNGVVINKNIAIDGKGHTIDAKNLGRIFSIGEGFTVTLTNTTLINGKADKGGAIYNDGSLTLSDVKLSDNTADSYGGAVFNNGHLVVSDSVFDSNDIVNRGSASVDYGGAAIYNWKEGTLKVTNSNFTNNIKNYKNGDNLVGAITTIGNATVSGSNFVNNSGRWGGAISATGAELRKNSSTLTVSNTIFRDNAALYAGAVYIWGSNYNIADCVFDNNTAFGKGNMTPNNNNGGALVVSQVSKFNEPITGTISGSKFTNNKAQYGGAAYFNKGFVTITDSVFENNIATAEGGAVGFSRASVKDLVVSINNSSFVGNKAPVAGAIFTNVDSKITNSNFTKNTASKGGAVLNENGAKLTVDNSTFKDNAADSYGGAVLNNGELIVTNSVFDANDILNRGSAGVDHGGAAIYNWENAKLDISKSNFTNNIKNYVNGDRLVGAVTTIGNATIRDSYFVNNSGRWGGALAATGGVSGSAINTISVDGTKFVNNTALYGGAMFVWASNYTISNSVFDNNSAFGKGDMSPNNNNGGALIVTQDNIPVSGKIVNSNFTNNKAQYGGAAWINEGTVDIDGSNFINNTATTAAGAIGFDPQYAKIIATVDSSKFVNNTAGSYAGAIYNLGDLTVSGSEFDNNKAQFGDIIYNNKIYNKEGILSINGNKYSNYTENKAPIINIGDINTISSTGGIIVTVLDNKTVNVCYGDVVTLHATVVADGVLVAGQKLFFVIDNVEYIANSLGNGSYIASYEVKDVGSKTVGIVYDESDVNIKTGMLNISKATPDLTVGALNITVGDLEIITVTGPKDATGLITLTLNGIDYTLPIYNGEAKFYFQDLTADEYEVSASYSGDNHYVAAENSTVFKVDKVLANLKINVEDITFGENGLVIITLPSDIDGSVVTVNVNGKVYPVTVENGFAKLPLRELNAGDYTISAVFAGNDKYLPGVSNALLTVSKADPALNVFISDVDYYGAFNINVALTGVDAIGLNGDVIVTVNGKDYTVNVVNGKGNVTGVKLAAGTYDFTAKFAGSDNYNDVSDSGNFKVNKVDSAIDVAVSDIKVGEDAVITVKLFSDATGSVTVTVNGKDYTEPVVNGVVNVKVSGLKADTYDVAVKYSGDNNYNAVVATSSFTVSKVDSTMDVTVDDIVFGEDLTVNAVLPADATGEVVITVDGVDYPVAIVDGKATGTISGLAAGDYTVSVKYAGDDKYAGVEFTGVVNVAKADAVLGVVIADVDYGNGFVIEATLTGVNGAPLTGNVIVTVNGKEYTVVVNDDGKGIATGDKLAADTYGFAAAWTGNNNYASVTENGDFKVNKVDSAIDVAVSDIKVGEDAVISVKLANDATGEVVITVNGEDYTAAIENGVASATVSDLKAGDYTVAVKYAGDNNYNGATGSAEFSVSKITSDMDVTVNNIVFGEDLTVDAVLPADATGEVVITVNGKDYHVAIDNGEAVQVVKDLAAGDYTVVVKYAGDDKYAGVEFTDVVNVAKADAALNVIINNVDYGNVFTVNAVLTGVNNAPLTGDVIVTVNGKDYTVNVVNGKGNVTGVKLAAGSYDFTAKFAGDNNYNAVSDSGKFNVNKVDSAIYVAVSDIKVGEDAVITVKLLSDATGNVTVNVNGKNYNGTVINGMANVEVSGLKADTYDVAVKYSGDNNYNDAVATSSFTVSKVDPTMDVTVDGIVFGEDLTVEAVLPADATGKVVIVVDGTSYTANITDGKATQVVKDLTAGYHTVGVKYGGDDKYNDVVVDGFVIVDKAQPVLGVVIADVNYGNEFAIEATLTGVNSTPLNGNVIVTVNGKFYVVNVTDGKGTLTGVKLAAGTYGFTAVWAGNDNYAAVDENGDFKVNKLNSTVAVNADDIKVGENVTVSVNVPSDATGNVIVTVDGKDYTVAIVDGKAVKTIADLKANNYTVTVKYDGDNNYNPNQNTTKFTVSKISDYNMNITVPGDVKVGEDAVIIVNVPKDASGNVTVSVGKEVYNAVISNGSAKVVVSDLAAGVYNVSANFTDDKYAQNKANATVVVSKVTDYNMNVTVPEFKEGVNSTISVDLPKDATGTVTVEIDGKKYTANVTNGTAKVNIPALSAGNHNITTTYSGDAKYDSMTKKGNITVIPNVNLDVNDVVMFYHDGTRLVAKLTDSQGKPIVNATIYFNINGVDYAKSTDDNGTASMGLNLDSNVYAVTVTYNGSDIYSKISKNVTVTINPSIIAKDLVKMYQNDTKFYAKFIGSDGKALVNTTVRFNIHGVFYNRTTNDDGIAELGIMLRPGNYILTAYNPVTGEEQGFNITVKSLIVQNDLTKYYLNASKFEATIYDKNGSLAVNKTVTFNIHGVFYTRSTDDKGVVSLGISLRPGEYIITTIYEGLAVGNNITVLPTLVTSDLNMTHEDGSNFTAQTLDGQGKPLANQNVTFNINGVFYNKVTDENGVASLAMRLMSGKYIITSYWNDFQTGNTIIIS